MDGGPRPKRAHLGGTVSEGKVSTEVSTGFADLGPQPVREEMDARARALRREEVCEASSLVAAPSDRIAEPADLDDMGSIRKAAH